MSYVLDGIKVGMILSVMLGPAFFAMTKRTIERGMLNGLLLTSGVWLSDILYIFASFFAFDVLQELNKSENFEYWMGIIGCIVLVAFGLGSFFSANLPVKRHKSNNFLPFFEGFSINTLNPFNVFFWLTVTTTMSATTDNFEVDAIYFYLGVLSTILLTDLLKVYFAVQLRRVLTDVHIQWMKRISGVALMLFGVYILLQSQHLV